MNSERRTPGPWLCRIASYNAMKTLGVTDRRQL